MKTAIVTDFLNQLGGAEWVTQTIASLFPDADIYTLMAKEPVLDKYFKGRTVYQHPKMANSTIRRKYYRKLFPLYPTYIEDFDLTQYDLIISSSYLWAKGILKRPDALHLSYIHTPMRQAWVKYHAYLNNENDVGRFSRFLLRYIMNYMRIWDVASANRVDHFIANSGIVKKRIASIYRREATVIHPPVKVNTLRDQYFSAQKQEYYLTLGRLVPYKRLDLIIDVFNELPDRKLLIIGDGNDRKRLQQRAQNANIEFLGYVNDERKNNLMAGARAFLFAAEEDFGISPVEAMAVGTPVIAYNKGGAQDYIKENINGLFFDQQHAASLKKAIHRFEEQSFDYAEVAASVAHFDETHFCRMMQELVDSHIAASP